VIDRKLTKADRGNAKKCGAIFAAGMFRDPDTAFWIRSNKLYNVTEDMLAHLLTEVYSLGLDSGRAICAEEPITVSNPATDPQIAAILRWATAVKDEPNADGLSAANVIGLVGRVAQAQRECSKAKEMLGSALAVIESFRPLADAARAHLGAGLSPSSGDALRHAVDGVADMLADADATAAASRPAVRPRNATPPGDAT